MQANFQDTKHFFEAHKNDQMSFLRIDNDKESKKMNGLSFSLLAFSFMLFYFCMIAKSDLELMLGLLSSSLIALLTYAMIRKEEGEVGERKRRKGEGME